MTTMTPCRDATPSVSQQYEKEITLLIIQFNHSVDLFQKGQDNYLAHNQQ